MPPIGRRSTTSSPRPPNTGRSGTSPFSCSSNEHTSGEIGSGRETPSPYEQTRVGSAADNFTDDRLKPVGGRSAGDGVKIPVSTLVVVHTPELRVLLIERADHPGYWQSVTGSQH